MAQVQAPCATNTPSSYRFSLHREATWMRWMAKMALASWFLPLILSVLTAFAPAAHAQATVQTVVVLDFGVSPGIDPLLGRKAADGLAVELQRSGDYEVVTRQRVEEAVGSQAGLQPPFNDTAQVRLAQAVGARSVFSGRVVSVELSNGKSARVRLEVKQLDANTGDFINGTQILESTEQKLQDVANEILVDEAINKADFSAVRSMKQTTLPEGTVLNTTKDDLEISIGARSGVAIGQRYTVLRDVFNKAKGVTERIKIGEVRITRVEADQAVAVVSAGGQAGVHTGDRVRQIFVPVNYPTTPINSTTSVTPVTAPPVSPEGDVGLGGIAKKSGKGVLGLVGLAALIGLAGFGGGGGQGGQGQVSGPFYSANTTGQPSDQLSFSSKSTGDFLNINRITRLNEVGVAAYMIFRDTATDFIPDADKLQAVIDATGFSPGQTLKYTDPFYAANGVIGTNPILGVQKVATLSSVGGSTSNNNNNSSSNNNNNSSSNSGGSSNVTVGVVISDGTGTGTGTGNTGNFIDLNGIGSGGTSNNNNNNNSSSGGSGTIQFTQRPLIPGTTYFYRVVPVLAVRQTSTGSTSNNNNSSSNNNNTSNNNNSGSGASVTITFSQGTASETTPGLTPVIRPKIVDERTGNPANTFNTDNFSLKLTPDKSQLSDPRIYDVSNANITSGVRAYRVEVSIFNTFPAANTLVLEQEPPTPDAAGQVTLNFGNIVVPGYNASTPKLFVRASSLSVTADQTTPGQPASDTLAEADPLGIDSVSRFLASPSNKLGTGIGINGIGSGRGASTPGYNTPRLLKPGQ